MGSDTIQKMQSRFDGLSHTIPDESIEFWFARDLMDPPGYARWENFQAAIRRAVESCKTTGVSPDNHFRGVTKMVKLGSGAERSIEDFMLTRYACCLIGMPLIFISGSAIRGNLFAEPFPFASVQALLAGLFLAAVWQ